jgi:hypothetical protein
VASDEGWGTSPGFARSWASDHIARLPCSFWLADNYTLQSRGAEARALFERLLSLRNDVGLLSEEYDPQAKRQVGIPQAFSHLALIGTALNLHDIGPAQRRAGEDQIAPKRSSERWPADPLWVFILPVQGHRRALEGQQELPLNSGSMAP